MNCPLPYRKACTLTVLILLLSFCGSAQKNNTTWDIESCFNRLPDSCFNLCDWRNEMAAVGIKTIDKQNGFLSFKRHKEEHDFFQAALFKGSNKGHYVAVSTRECEAFACFHPRSFFFVRQKETLVQADSILFSGITTLLFYQDTSLGKLSEDYQGYFRFNFILPQKGTTVRVELDICDYLTEDHPAVSEMQYQKLISEKKTILLQWHPKENRFRIINKANGQ